MGILQYTTRVHLSTRIANPQDRIAPAGTWLWVINYTVSENGRERSFVAHAAAEVAARRMVANLLADRLPGKSEVEVYSEDVSST